MQRAYVLINCDTGTEKELVEQLMRVNNVKEVHSTFGAYDIVAKIESKKPETLKEIITDHIRKLEHIRSTVTLMGVEEAESQEQNNDLIPDIIPDEKKPLEPPTREEEFEDDYDDEDDDFSEKKVLSDEHKQRYKDVYKRRYRDTK